MNIKYSLHKLKINTNKSTHTLKLISRFSLGSYEDDYNEFEDDVDEDFDSNWEYLDLQNFKYDRMSVDAIVKTKKKIATLLYFYRR